MTPALAEHFAAVRRALAGLPDRAALLSLDAIEREVRRLMRAEDVTVRVEVPR